MPSAGPVDEEPVGQRLVTFAAIVSLAAIAAAAAPGAAGRLPNWAAPQIATVVAHRLMDAPSVRKFRPNAVLTRQTLANLAVGLRDEVGPPAASSSGSGSTETTTTATTTTGTTATGTTGTTTTTATTTVPDVSNPTAQVTMAQL